MPGQVKGKVGDDLGAFLGVGHQAAREAVVMPATCRKLQKGQNQVIVG
jgi:hypothetical protein